MKSTLTIAQRTTPVRSRRSLASQWDRLVIGLMVCSAAYGICAVAGTAGS